MNNDIYVTPEILISGEVDKMEITALNIKAMTEMFIAKDDDKANLVYYIDVKQIFDTAGIEFNRFSYRRFRDIGSKELAEKNKYISFINENENFEQMPYFQDIEWLEKEGLVKVTLSQRFKEIYTDPSLKKIKGHLKDTLALETKTGVRMFPKLVLRYNKSQHGTKRILFKAEGSLYGKEYLDIWPIKKYRREFSMNEKTYHVGMIKKSCEAIADDITQHTEYDCQVYFNYWKDPSVKHANKTITHICWNLEKKVQNSITDANNDNQFISDISLLGYDHSDAAAISAALVRNGETIEYFQTLHDHISRHTGIHNSVGWLIVAIGNHYEVKKGISTYNNFAQRNYSIEDYRTLENKMRSKQ